MSRKATINDVAAAAGVSIKTVSRVFNGEPNVRSATEEKVRQAAAQLHYSPNLSARRLAANRSFLIGLVYDNPEGTNSFIPDVQRGALDACQKANYELIIHPADAQDPSAGSQLVDLVAKLSLDGLIILPPFSDNQPLLDLLREKKIHFSRMSQSYRDAYLPCVSVDDEDAAMTVTQYLVEQGHTRIAFVKGNPKHGASADRLRGFKKALTDARIPLDPALIVEGDFSFAAGREAGRRLFSLADRPTAVFACNDDMAAGVLAEAHIMNISVPDELSICGYDDVSIACQVWPPLTTVRQPIKAIAHSAAMHLFADIRGETINDETAPSSFHSELIVRSSSGSAP